ncbi:hypothetical protein ACV336_07830, partial [Pseudomonas aeruginosa]
MIDSDTQPAAEEAEKKPPHPWAELAPEHFRLLRLAPLPTDRATGARPLRFVQLGRVERHSADQSLLRLSIQVPGLMLRKEQNLLEVWADHRNKEVRFGSDAGLSLEPLNRGLAQLETDQTQPHGVPAGPGIRTVAHFLVAMIGPALLQVIIIDQHQAWHLGAPAQQALVR